MVAVFPPMSTNYVVDVITAVYAKGKAALQVHARAACYAARSHFSGGPMAIKLNQDTEARLQASLQRYCAQNFDEDIGALKARLLLDFCLREIGPSIYNQAVQDAQAVMQEKIAEVETNCYETEFAYWQKK